MEFNGSYRIPAPREAVWAALEDPDIVMACLPGCERLVDVGRDRFEGALNSKIGPIKATFTGQVTRTEAETPHRFVLVAEGNAGEAGSAIGRADVALAAEGRDTLLSYSADAEFAGKISQLGSRLVGGVVRQAIEGFLSQLAGLAESGALSSHAIAEAPPLVHEEPIEPPATVDDAPPLAATTITASTPKPIAPTAVPDLPEDPAVPVAEQAPPPAGSGAVTRIMVIASVVVAIGALLYYIVWQAPH